MSTATKVGVTAYLFAHLPHPEGVHWQESPFQATYSLTGNQLTKSALWRQSSHAIASASLLAIAFSTPVLAMCSSCFTSLLA